MFYTSSLREWSDLLDQISKPVWETSTPSLRRNWNFEAREVENGFEVEMVIPGYEKDQIQIEAEFTTVHVFSETKNKWGQKFSQKIAVPDNCEIKEITAEYKNGVLTILFPVREEREEAKFLIKIK
jgi:HSP20 family molecular chaperone IbpA